MAKGSKMALVARRYLGVIEARKAGLKARERITVDELAERYRDDFPGFCDLLDIVTKDGHRRKLLPLTSTQEAFCANRTGRDDVLKPRQVGITTIELARDIWFWLTRRGSRVVIVVQSSTDHGPLKDISEKLRIMLESLERANVALHWRMFSTAEWALEGREGAIRIIEAGASEAAAQKKGRGGTVHRLHVTEASFFEYADVTLNALLESVPDRKYGSEIVFESTANGASGWFYDHYQGAKEGNSGFKAHFFRWFDFREYQTPLAPGEMLGAASQPDQAKRESVWREQGVTEAQIKWYRAKLAEKRRQDLVDQEYPSDEETCWIISGNCFFEQAVTHRLLTVTTEPIERITIRRMGDDGAVAASGELRVYHRPERGRQYVISVDTSEGLGGKHDASAAHVYERGTGRLMAVLDGQLKPWALARELGGRSLKTSVCLGATYFWALIAVERNNHGHAVLRALYAEQHYPNIFRDLDTHPGWKNHEVTRAPALDTLEEVHRSGAWKPLDRAVLKQLRTFVVNDRGKPEAARGSHDDHVLAGAIGWDVICRPLPKPMDLDALPAF